MAASLKSVFFLLAAGLLLIPLPLLGLSAWRGDFHVAARGRGWTPNSLMSSLNSVLYFLAAGLLLLPLPVLGLSA